MFVKKATRGLGKVSNHGISSHRPHAQPKSHGVCPCGRVAFRALKFLKRPNEHVCNRCFRRILTETGLLRLKKDMELSESERTIVDAAKALASGNHRTILDASDIAEAAACDVEDVLDVVSDLRLRNNSFPVQVTHTKCISPCTPALLAKAVAREKRRSLKKTLDSYYNDRSIEPMIDEDDLS